MNGSRITKSKQPLVRLLQQVHHLLESTDSADPILKQEIEDLRIEVVNAVYLCTIDQEVVARAQLEGVIGPRVDALIAELGSRPTEPPTE